MSSSDIVQISTYFIVLFALTPPIGAYMAAVFSGESTVVGRVLGPIERFIYRICLINPSEEMHWKKYSLALLSLSAWGFLLTLLLQLFQSVLPLNPQELSAVGFAQAFNTAASFVTNTNWQTYSGEATLGYFVQLFGLTVQNFLSAATGMGVLLVIARALTRQKTNELGNFWVDLVRCTLYLLLPLSALFALVLVSQGVVQNFMAYISSTSLEGASHLLPMGPAASQIAIKQLGTNGGGFFGANSAHPFENPTALTNFLQMLAILMIPSAQLYAFGILAKARKHALIIYFVMFGILVCTLLVGLWSEMHGNPAVGLASQLEGKETRFGVSSSILWSVLTTAASSGSINAALDSLSPLSGGMAFLQIALGEVVFGGVGAGLYAMFLFVLLTVFLAGLMVGRTPEYLGKKLEGFEMKWALVAIIGPSAAVLILGAATVILLPKISSVLNQGPHGLSEIMYAYASAAQNNGSAFGGFPVDSALLNVVLGLTMLFGRFLVILSVLAICGSLVEKRITPPSQGTFSTDTPIFAVLLFATILIMGALTFVPVLSLSAIAEHFLMLSGRTF